MDSTISAHHVRIDKKHTILEIKIKSSLYWLYTSTVTRVSTERYPSPRLAPGPILQGCSGGSDVVLKTGIGLRPFFEVFVLVFYLGRS